MRKEMEKKLQMIIRRHPTASMLCPLSLPCKKAQAVRLKAKLKRPILREFCDYR